jgi:hypothetical protein
MIELMGEKEHNALYPRKEFLLAKPAGKSVAIPSTVNIIVNDRRGKYPLLLVF